LTSKNAADAAGGMETAAELWAAREDNLPPQAPPGSFSGRRLGERRREADGPSEVRHLRYRLPK